MMNRYQEYIETLEERLLNPEPDLSYLSARQQYELILSKVSNLPEPIITPEGLLEKLQESKETGRPLRIKFGIDPTGPDIHIGHTVSLINLSTIQRMGHIVILLIGDFTALVGDPSGRKDSRPLLTLDEIHQNMATYEHQAARVIELTGSNIERRYNSEWMHDLSISNWVEVIRKVSVSELLQRKDFKARLEVGSGFSVAELEYILYMAYDSVALQPDIEVGGTDQFLNFHMCRQLMVNAGLDPEVAITYNLLPGTTGLRDEAGELVKMSKSLGNDIPVTAKPSEMYGKTMSVPDEVMWVWFRELTDITLNELEQLQVYVDEGKIHPKDVKQLLARVVVGVYNYFDAGTIRAAENDFNAKFGKEKELIPDSTQPIVVEANTPLIELMSQATDKSRSELRRLVTQQGIYLLKGVNYVPITAEELHALPSDLDGDIVRIGKRHYFRLV